MLSFLALLDTPATSVAQMLHRSVATGWVMLIRADGAASIPGMWDTPVTHATLVTAETGG